MLGDPDEPGKYPVNLDARKPLSGEELFQVSCIEGEIRQKPSAGLPELWAEAVYQVGKGWLEGPFFYAADGKLLIDG